MTSKNVKILRHYLAGVLREREIAVAVGVTEVRVHSAIAHARKMGRIPRNFKRKPGTSKIIKPSGCRSPLLVTGRKRCCRCHKIKRLSSRAFAHDKSTPSGWHPICKLCIRARMNRAYDPHVARIKKQALARRRAACPASKPQKPTRSSGAGVLIDPRAF